jgi:hypothetical protein
MVEKKTTSATLEQFNLIRSHAIAKWSPSGEKSSDLNV